MKTTKTSLDRSKWETRADQTTAAATEIVDKVNSDRTKKTELLRAARLKRDQAEGADITKSPRQQKTSKKQPKS
ncbi:hypothetical protein DSM110093_02772 [Sulfitobacter sp. DSM 110093]|uniref:hypothetical protein n=1 Tax=Sulfitobacter sp. DSM 110093 TaxID=2883127 RepID=UPI001FAE01A6|nr:hypothetical protein [Sulfitobacter sp. DSM 110093]UOA32963.1 hypothetical protein DSM110093_02772 [Sulfitobacter sp. DSM 110093]